MSAAAHARLLQPPDGGAGVGRDGSVAAQIKQPEAKHGLALATPPSLLEPAHPLRPLHLGQMVPVEHDRQVRPDQQIAIQPIRPVDDRV